MLAERVHLADVFKEHAPDVLAGHAQRVDVDVLRGVLAVVGPHAEHVAFVGHDIVELVLPEEALGRGIALALLLPGLDGDGEVVVAEAEGEQEVGDGWPHPVHGHQICRVQLVQIVGAVVVRRSKVRLRPVVEVPDVVHGDHIAVESGIDELGDLGLPVALIGGLQTAPPDADRHEGHREDRQRDPVTPAKHEGDDSDEPGHAVQGGQNEPALVAAGSHDRQGQRAPARDGQRDESDQPANGARQEPAHEPSPLSIERSLPFKASVGL